MLRLDNSRYYNEDELIRLAKNGDENAIDAILNKYKNLVRIIVNKYYMPGAGKDDLRQEGCLGIIYAIRDYKTSKKSPFSSFVEMCIKRHIKMAILAATRKKHSPLNTYIPLSKPIGDGERDATFLDMLNDKSRIYNPEDVLIKLEMKEELERKLKSTLSELESDVLLLYSKGKSYGEMASEIKKGIKTIDNALQRAKKKVIEIIADCNSP